MQYERIEKQLHLPNKVTEIQLFEAGKLGELFDAYVPLVEFLLQDYVCTTSVERTKLEEQVYDSLLMVLLKYKRKGCHLKSYTFTEFFAMLIEDSMKEFMQEGEVLCVADTKIL